MNDETLKKYLEAATADRDSNPARSAGYCSGLRRHYYGDKFQVPDGLPQADDERGDGYRLGLTGAPYPTLHALTGKRSNRQRGDVEMKAWTLRIAQDEKNNWVRMAQKEGKNLSTWVRDTLNAAVK